MTRRMLLGSIPLLSAWAKHRSLILTDTSDKTVAIDVAAERVTVVIFVSTLCPVSNAYHDRFKALVNTYVGKPVRFVFVNANDNETMAEVREHAQAAELSFPVYKDWKNIVADELGASMTPEAFVIDGQGKIRYHGAIDDAKVEARVKIAILADATRAVLEAKVVARSEMKAFGCTIHRYRKSS